jgi:hypothetical protein
MFVLTETVMLPVGTPLGIPGVTPAAPTVGRGEFPSTFQPVGVTAGQEGGVVLILATYCEEDTPVGWIVAHLAIRLSKSG